MATDLKDVEAARDAVEDAARAARERVSDASHELLERAGSARTELTGRAGTAAGHVRERLEDADLESKVRHAKIGFWGATRAVLGALLTLPAATVRGLGSLSTITDEAVDRGTELSDRSRAFVRTAAVTPKQRARARRRTAAWTVGGFVVGVLAGAVGGYLFARRDELSQDDLGELAHSGAERARDAAHQAIDSAGDAAVGTLEREQGAAVDVTERAKEAAHHVADAAHDAADTAADRVAASDNGDAGTAAADRGSNR